ncbi:hypothetical protein [Aureliella helgolandensis]|uniref:hypothetical protein n=1 Tax=Aureliella helgolandensis TaxID=2527968 RepID=UPI0011A0E939|nr:hypothetical protein [Aureliella helgolandensis]
MSAIDPQGELWHIVGGGAAGCVGGGIVAGAGGWWKGRSKTNIACRSGLGCAIAAIPGMVAAGNPALLKCMVGVAYGLSSTIPGAVCDLLTDDCTSDEAYKKVGCSVMKNFMTGVASCLTGDLGTIEGSVAAAAAAIWGIDFAAYCRGDDWSDLVVM